MMSLLLHVYKASRHRSFKTMPGGWRVRRFCRQLVAGRTYRAPYLRGSVWLNPGNVIADSVLLTREYEPRLGSIISSFVEAGFSFVDVGANIGLHTLRAGFAHRDTSQRLIAFEPEPRTRALLERNLKANNIPAECHGVALGEREGHVTLYVADGWNQGAHSLTSREETSSETQVPITTLDTFFLSRNKEPLNRFLLKIDIEGSEPSALAGGIRWLAQATECAVLIEVFPQLLKASGREPREIAASLAEAGLHPVLVVRDADDDEVMDDRNLFFNVLFAKGSSATTLATTLKERSDSVDLWNRVSR